MPDTAAQRKKSCPACASADLEVFYRIPQIPVESCLLFDDRAAARAVPRRSFSLAFCRCCGFIFNRDHDPSIKQVTGSSGEIQAVSQRYRNFCEEICRHLIAEYGLRNKRLLEVGCGNGYFLSTICAMGENRGIGIDPAIGRECLAGAPVGPLAGPPEIDFIQASFSRRFSELAADCIICRHTLEHVLDVRGLAGLIARQVALNPGAVAFLEVPNSLRILESGAFWDIYYEHCSYFTCGSLARLLRSLGLKLLDLRLAFGEQYILVEACGQRSEAESPAEPEESLGVLEATVRTFTQKAAAARAAWREVVAAHAGRGGVVLWGSAPKSAAFAVALDCALEAAHVVNINPGQQGRYVAGTGQRVIAPQALRDLRPSLVINMNSLYEHEIEAELRGLGLDSGLLSVDDPRAAADLAEALA